MSNAVKKAILQKKVEGVVTDLMVKTSAENVVVDAAGKTLSAALSEIITDMAGKVDKVDGKGLSTEDFTTALKQKLEGITGYTHPDSHPASMITQDATHRFATDAEKASWNAKGRVLSGATAPADLGDNDLFIQVVQEA